MKTKSHTHSPQPAESRKRLEFDKFFADLSAKFVALPSEEVDDAITNAMKEILGFFQVDRCVLLKLLPCRTSYMVTHGADIPGVTPSPIGTVLPVSMVPYAFWKLAEQREILSFARLEDLPEEASVDKKISEQFGIRSGLYIPVAALRSSEYTLGINSLGNDRNFGNEDIPRLRLLGELFVNAVERSSSEKALRESEERLNLAASSAEAGLWIMSSDAGITWATPKLRELLCVNPDEELHFNQFLSLIHPDDRTHVKDFIQQSLRKKETLNIEYRIVRPDGSIHWISSRGNPSSEGSGRSDCLTGVSIDVTGRKQIEAELRERLDEIEQLKVQLEKENIYLRKEIKAEKGFEKIVGTSDAFRYVLFRVRQVAPTDATALILGETGTGKGLLATTLHELSARQSKPMVTVNCAALPANLIESELFGHEKGAFTGAHARQVGRFEVADGGTIFLDEIGEMPLELQAKLLRVLQEGEFERLGSARTIKVDVRVIASTSRDLKTEVRNGRFREDLYYRLHVFPISIPPLRMRTEDIPQLVRYFVHRYAQKLGRKYETVPKSMMKSLQDYSWPGNVRELEHVIERAVITNAGPVLQLADQLETSPVKAEEEPPKELVTMERNHILKILQKTHWKIDGKGGAASLLGLHPSTLRFRLKKLGIKRP